MNNSTAPEPSTQTNKNDEDLECVLYGPKDESLSAIFNPNATTNLEETICFSRGIISKDVIHLGTWWHSG